MSMEQEIEVIVRMTYMAPATLSREQLLEEINNDLSRLLDGDSTIEAQMLECCITQLREEAEIYGNV